MALAAVDVLGVLPSPASKANNSACQLLEAQVLAYAVSNTIAIVDVRQQSLFTSHSFAHVIWRCCKMCIFCCQRCTKVNMPFLLIADTAGDTDAACNCADGIAQNSCHCHQLVPLPPFNESYLGADTMAYSSSHFSCAGAPNGRSGSSATRLS